jgi:hypothetical protein
MTDSSTWDIRRIALERTSEMLVVGLGAGEEPDGRSLVLQKPLSPDLVDQTDPDSYFVSNERGVTVCGGIRSWDLAGNELCLTFSPDAADPLGLGESLTLALQPVNSAEIDRVGRALVEVFDGSPRPP